MQDPVVKLCCSWWELKAPGRENYVPQTLPYLLVRGRSTALAVLAMLLCALLGSMGF